LPEVYIIDVIGVKGRLASLTGLGILSVLESCQGSKGSIYWHSLDGAVVLHYCYSLRGGYC